jgi:hypothetical protein
VALLPSIDDVGGSHRQAVAKLSAKVPAEGRSVLRDHVQSVERWEQRVTARRLALDGSGDVESSHERFRQRLHDSTR